jgi:hypothetical protein
LMLTLKDEFLYVIAHGLTSSKFQVSVCKYQVLGQKEKPIFSLKSNVLILSS